MRVRGYISAFAPLLVALILAASCNFRPLKETANVSYVRVYVDEQILNVTTGFYNKEFRHPTYSRPDILRVALFDAQSGALVSERYLRNQGDDERGHYYDGYIIVEPGTYDFVAYNFGTESTVLSEEYNCFKMCAYTNEISSAVRTRLQEAAAASASMAAAAEGAGAEDVAPYSLSDEPSIRYDADHLFVSSAEGLQVAVHGAVDTLRNSAGEPWFRAESIVKSYYIQIGVRGIQYISSSSSVLSGMAASTRIIDRDFESGGSTALYFDMTRGRYTKYDQSYACIYSTFGTFGRLPESDNEIRVSFEFITTYGTRFEKTFDISRKFLEEDAIVHQWIIIEDEIVIPAPPDPDPDPDLAGGLTPSVDPWGDVESEFDI